VLHIDGNGVYQAADASREAVQRWLLDGLDVNVGQSTAPGLHAFVKTRLR
jgi:hypothetical protein